MQLGLARARSRALSLPGTGAVCRRLGALALLMAVGCAADDKVLTPDEMDGGAGDAMAGDAAGNGAARDGGTTGDAGGNDGGGTGQDAGPAIAKDPGCDLNGIWIGRQNTESLALFDTSQFANNWYYLELAQHGEDVIVTRHFDCGIEVQGTVLVELAPDTTRALMMHNSQVGRRGRFSKQPDGTCSFEMETFWSVRGVSEETYVPKPRNTDTAISQLDTKLPSKAEVAATQDWDGDGQYGVTWQVSGIVKGARYSSQRDWTRWFSAPGYLVQAADNFQADLVVRADFSNEEVVYPPIEVGLDQTSAPRTGAEHAVTLRFLGRTRDDPRALELIESDDFQTCLAIQSALPAVKGFK